MKILLLQETDWKDKGPHQQHHLIERLVKRGHDTRIIDYDINWRDKTDNSIMTKRMEIDVPSKTIDGVTIRLIRPRMIRLPILCYISVLFWHTLEIFRQIKQFNPDVIIGMSVLNTWIALFYSRLLRIPFINYWIDSFHDLIPEKLLGKIAYVVVRFVLRRSDKILAINDELARFQIELGAEKERVRVVAAGVAVERFNPSINGSKIRLIHNVSSDEILLLFMGWIYNFSGIIEVAQGILQSYKSDKIKLMVVGKGDAEEELRAMSQRPESKGRIIIKEWVDYKDLPQYVAASDIGLLPAYLNNIMRYIVPIKLYEYLACGKPVIATRLPGVLKEFGDGNGIVYINNPDETINKAIELVEQRALESLGNRSAEFALRRDWKEYVDRFYSILVDTCRMKRELS